MRNGQYILIVAPIEYPGKKYRSRYCYEHHFNWWKKTGLLVPKGFVVHHKNENKHDNTPGNLECITADNHNSHHSDKRRIIDPNAKCSNCSIYFRVRPHKLKNKFVFCSRKCIGLYSFPKKHSSVAQQ